MIRSLWLARVVAGHRYTSSAFLIGILTYVLLPRALGITWRVVAAWDVAAAALLLLLAFMLLTEGDQAAMARNAEAQQEGEWTVFAITLLGALVSFAALTHLLSGVKDLPSGGPRELHVLWVAGTLFLTWVVTHAVFGLRYAHEFYTRTGGAASVDGGLDFPGDLPPDYWDFLYFALVLGMTFQVSDVQITSRKLRRLATIQGLIGFLFNAVIIALSVNIAASLL